MLPVSSPKRGPYWLNLLIGLDQFVGTIFGIPSDITISGWVGYKHHGSLLERFINWLFNNPNHCVDSIEWDIIWRYYKS